MVTRALPLFVLAPLLLEGWAVGQDPISPEEFRTLQQLIKPQEGEFAWYDDIPWMTRVQPARERAAAEGKPLLIWTSADGQPCGAG
jgi:pantothenate kinase-related protein Tda10